MAIYRLPSPNPSNIGPPPADLPAKEIVFDGADGAKLHGWLVPASHAKASILLLHGVHANRLQMLPRARFLHREGYSVLLYDSRAHGESTGNAVTFGYLESRDAVEAVRLLRSFEPQRSIGIIGVSLGGAAALLARATLDAQAIVAESVYPAIDDAISDRMRIYFGSPGAWSAPLLTSFLRPRLGFSASELRPIDAVRELRTPKLFLFGTRDRHTRLEESLRLYEAAAEPKASWQVENAAHVDLHEFTPSDYERRILKFFRATL